MSMSECIDVMSDAMVSASTGTVSVPPRHFTSIIDDSTLLGLMPGASEELNAFGVKLISFYRSNPQKNLPAIQGFVALFNFENVSAALKIIMDSEGIAQKWRRPL